MKDKFQFYELLTTTGHGKELYTIYLQVRGYSGQN
jgi:hypothetical protein